MTVGDEDVLFYNRLLHAHPFPGCRYYIIESMFAGLFSPFPGTQIMPRTGMENRVNADTLTGRLL